MADYTLGLYEKALPGSLSWGERLRETKIAGFDYLEMSIDESDEKLARLEMPSDKRFELVRLMYDYQLPIRSICLSGHRKYPLGSHEVSVRLRSFDILQKTINLADDLGVRMIQLAGYDVYYETSDEKTRKLFSEALARACELASQAGVLLGFETMETKFMNTVKKAMRWVSEMASPYLAIYPDIGNITNAMLNSSVSMFSDLRTGKGHLVALHLKETLPGIFREVPFGEGHVDFNSAIETAWQLGVRRYVAEMWHAGGEDWKTDIAAVNKMMRDILDRQKERVLHACD